MILLVLCISITISHTWNSVGFLRIRTVFGFVMITFLYKYLLKKISLENVIPLLILTRKFNSICLFWLAVYRCTLLSGRAWRHTHQQNIFLKKVKVKIKITFSSKFFFGKYLFKKVITTNLKTVLIPWRTTEFQVRVIIISMRKYIISISYRKSCFAILNINWQTHIE